MRLHTAVHPTTNGTSDAAHRQQGLPPVPLGHSSLNQTLGVVTWFFLPGTALEVVRCTRTRTPGHHVLRSTGDHHHSGHKLGCVCAVAFGSRGGTYRMTPGTTVRTKSRKCFKSCKGSVEVIVHTKRTSRKFVGQESEGITDELRFRLSVVRSTQSRFERPLTSAGVKEQAKLQSSDLIIAPSQLNCFLQTYRPVADGKVHLSAGLWRRHNPRELFRVKSRPLQPERAENRHSYAEHARCNPLLHDHYI